jgi:hypothetical protein
MERLLNFGLRLGSTGALLYLASIYCSYGAGFCLQVSLCIGLRLGSTGALMYLASIYCSYGAGFCLQVSLCIGYAGIWRFLGHYASDYLALRCISACEKNVS